MSGGPLVNACGEVIGVDGWGRARGAGLDVDTAEYLDPDRRTLAGPRRPAAGFHPRSRALQSRGHKPRSAGHRRHHPVHRPWRDCRGAGVHQSGGARPCETSRTRSAAAFTARSGRRNHHRDRLRDPDRLHRRSPCKRPCCQCFMESRASSQAIRCRSATSRSRSGAIHASASWSSRQRRAVYRTGIARSGTPRVGGRDRRRFGSTNGTFLSSGVELRPGEPRALRPTDRFYLGDPVNLFEVRFEARS